MVLMPAAEILQNSSQSIGHTDCNRIVKALQDTNIDLDHSVRADALGDSYVIEYDIEN